MRKLLLLLGLIIGLSLSSELNAQPPGGGPPGGGGCIPPPCVPIDGGLSFLLAAGVAYGGKKLLDHKK
jgi:hypothetical protein